VADTVVAARAATRQLAIQGEEMVLLLIFLAASAFSTFGQMVDQKSPVVAAASVPLYPHTALLAHIQGIAKIRVATDGKKISSLEVESGPHMLGQAAEENIRTWQFEEHKPTTFIVTFEYRIEEPAGCSIDNGTVVLHLPLDVQISAKGVHTCDPASEAPHSKSG
jgi:outer membrane biosynthesis protein TonB